MNILMLTSPAPTHAPFSTSEKRPPLGVGYLISTLKQRGHRVFFSDEYLRPSNILGSSFILDQAIDFVGIYANTICYSETLKLLAKLSERRHNDHWQGKIIMGGPHTSFNAADISAEVDHIVIGEGDQALVEIIEGHTTARIVQGTAVADLDTLPPVAWEEFVWRSYDWTYPLVDTTPVYTFNTSRGCPFDCSFCSVQGVWGKGYRAMSAARIVSDIEWMIRYYGLKAAYFREDNFTLDKDRLTSFCELLLNRGIAIDWLCETRADSINDDQLLALMARSGCKALYVGVESGSQRMLDYYRKGILVETFVAALTKARKHGIKLYTSFIVGAPNETEADLQETYRLLDRLKPDAHSLNIFVGIPGSELYREMLDQQLYGHIDPHGIAYLKNHNKLVDRFYQGNSHYKINYALAETKSYSGILQRLTERLRGCRGQVIGS